ncbi:ATP-binding protein [Novosphingobium aquae]|uniref:ATP-binding protein n=1 Tax=Novosphingobium aquae TaxID=3133435 RepID=A0ABU8SCM1_9SPHN
MIAVCFHGVESTGKSLLAAKLSADLGCAWVPEYGREYCEAHGTDLTMADLLAIAEGQARAVESAAAKRPALLILDTDQLMTAAWAQMLFGDVPPVLMAYPKADHYLHFAADVPWIDDGTRFFGTAGERARFDTIARAVLVDAGITALEIAGDWAEREAGVRQALAEFRAKA